MFTVVASVMTKHTTTEDVHELFKKQVDTLLQAGWEPVGVPLYYPNGITQCMTLGPVSSIILETISAVQSKGSPVPHEFVYRFGGRGPFGEKHWYDEWN